MITKIEKSKFNNRAAGILKIGKYVLLQKKIGDKFWALPGGRIEFNEDSSSTVVREFQEELGVQIKTTYFRILNEYFYSFNNKEIHEIAFFYDVEVSNNFFNHLLIKEGIEFKGLEQDMVFKWFNILSLNEDIIRPSFLADELRNNHTYFKHIITED